MASSSEKWTKTYTSFSGADIVATMTPVGGAPVVIGELQTISYSIHREKKPVWGLGHVNAKGFTKGPRTVAGSLIFTVLDRHLVKTIALYGLAGEPYDDFTEEDRLDMYTNMKVDELPPIDVTITMHNEYNNSAMIRIYGITFIDEGQVMSIEDMITEQTLSYLAVDIDVMGEVDIGGGV